MSIVISPIITLDGSHVMSFAEDYSKLTGYFNCVDFINVVNDRELSKELLVELSTGLTNHIRASKDFDWSEKCVAVVSKARAVKVDEDTQKVVFEVGIISDHEG